MTPNCCFIFTMQSSACFFCLRSLSEGVGGVVYFMFCTVKLWHQVHEVCSGFPCVVCGVCGFGLVLARVIVELI